MKTTIVLIISLFLMVSFCYANDEDSEIDPTSPAIIAETDMFTPFQDGVAPDDSVGRELAKLGVFQFPDEQSRIRDWKGYRKPQVKATNRTTQIVPNVPKPNKPML